MRLDAELLKKTGVFALVSGEITALVGGGYFLGKYLDNRFGFEPTLAVILAMLGLGIGSWRIWLYSRSWFKPEEKK